MTTRGRARTWRRRRGSAYVVVLVFSALLLAAALLVWGSLPRGPSSAAPLDATLRADNALAKGKLRVLADFDALAAHPTSLGWDLLDEDGAHVTIMRLGGSPLTSTFALRAMASAEGVEREVELVVEATALSPRPLAAPHLAALVARGDVRLTGSITIDGRDHAPDGTLLGPGPVGVLTPGTLRRQGAATVGGGDAAPSRLPVEGVAADSATTLWTEPDPTDGTDDDGDGLVDEAGFPERAEDVLGAPGGSLRERAVADGTLFTSKDDYDAWRVSTSPEERGGRVVYLEVPPGTDVGVLVLPDNAPQDRWGGPRWPAPRPSIVVVAGAASAHDTAVGPLHVDEAFQGVVVVDRLAGLNGVGRITGSVVVMGARPGRPAVLGNGAAQVLFSGAVLDDLPTLTRAPPRLWLRSWRVVR